MRGGRRLATLTQLTSPLVLRSMRDKAEIRIGTGHCHAYQKHGNEGLRNRDIMHARRKQGGKRQGYTRGSGWLRACELASFPMFGTPPRRRQTSNKHTPPSFHGSILQLDRPDFHLKCGACLFVRSPTPSFTYDIFTIFQRLTASGLRTKRGKSH